jgi:hypothetical protein
MGVFDKSTLGRFDASVRHTDALVHPQHPFLSERRETLFEFVKKIQKVLLFLLESL